MLVEITRRNIGNFRALAPKRELSRLENDEDCFGIGYTDDALSFPDGILIFHLEEEEEKGEVHPIAVIDYFYVREEARDMYVGTYLFSILVEMAEECHIEALRCDVPMGYEYNLLCNVLENYGFHFSLVEVFEFERPLHDYMELGVFKKRKPGNVLLLYEVPQKVFSVGLRNLTKDEDLSDYDISYDKENYDVELSTVLIQDKLPVGIFLVRIDKDGCIVPELLRTSSQSSDAYLSMIYDAMEVANDKYGKNATVKVRLHNDAGLHLMSDLFEDFAPYLVRRGYFVI